MADAELALVRISIHALREEGDLALSSRPYQSAIFLSTPSARRATNAIVNVLLCFIISIHALREEGDSNALPSVANIKYFYPRPPRGGRRPFKFCARPGQFISIHALREEGDR